MKEETKKILEELYEADPDLKKTEEQIIPIIEKLMKGKKNITMDGAFQRDLRERLLSEIPQSGKKRRIKGKTIFIISSAAAALLTVALVLPFMTRGLIEEEAPLMEMQFVADEARMTMAEPQPMVMTKEREVPENDFNTEDYDRIYESAFINPLETPLSTFSIDVDTASYGNVRRFLRDGMLPPPDAVRIEELINYFNYDYKEPSDNVPFKVNTMVSKAPWNEENLLVRIALQGKKISFDELPPNNLVFLLDVSGSMNDRDKLPLLKKALTMIVNNMRRQDSISIVVYAGAAGTVLEPTYGNNPSRILEALENLEAGGSTAGAEGILLAYEKAQENFDPQGNNRIIMATDGDFNVGISSDGELIRLIEEKRESGIGLTVLGFGSGNLKDSRMEQIANKGNGNYAYIDSLLEARKVLVEEMGGTFFTIAKDVKLQVEFNPALVESYRLIGYENRMLNREDFDDDTKDAGELGAGHSVTAFYELIPSKGDSGSNVLKYQDTTVSEEAKSGKELLHVNLRYKEPDSNSSELLAHPVLNKVINLEQADDDFRFASSVALWGMLLRQSEYSGQGDFDTVLDMAREARGDDSEGYRNEFLQLVKLSAELDR